MNARDETFETCGHTTREGILNLSVNVGIPDAEVEVVVHVKRSQSSEAADEKGWPSGYFESLPGSMPELRRPFQGHFEDRLSLR